MKSLVKGGFSEKQYFFGDIICIVEMLFFFFCLSEEVLDLELYVFVIFSLREKIEFELKFEEDERWIMMEVEEEWEEEKLLEGGEIFLMVDEKKSSLVGIFEGE